MKGFYIEKRLKKHNSIENISIITQPIPTEKISLERKLEGKKPVLFAFENESVLAETSQKDENSTTKSMEQVEMKKSKNNGLNEKNADEASATLRKLCCHWNGGGGGPPPPRIHI